MKPKRRQQKQKSRVYETKFQHDPNHGNETSSSDSTSNVDEEQREQNTDVSNFVSKETENAGETSGKTSEENVSEHKVYEHEPGDVSSDEGKGDSQDEEEDDFEFRKGELIVDLIYNSQLVYKRDI